MANLETEFHEPLTHPGTKRDEKMGILLFDRPFCKITGG